MKAQTYPDWEILVVDDKSDDRVYSELQTLASEKIQIFQRADEPKGPSACRNIGAGKAKGKYLLFLDSDDMLMPFCLEQRVGQMESNGSLDAGVFLMEALSDESQDVGKMYNSDLPDSEWVSAFIRNQNPWNVTCPIWKKDAFERVGGFDESFFYMEDPELHVRALQAGLKFRTFYQYPADCRYRMNYFDEAKSDFYYNSIFYRLRFYEKLTSGFYPPQFVKKHTADIKTGINQLIKTFLYSRVNQFPDLYQELMRWMKSSGIYNKSEMIRYSLLMKIGNTDNRFLRAMKVRGVCYRML